MCEKTNYKDSNTSIDKCIRAFVRNLKQGCEGKYKIIGSCCGHKKYPMTIVAKDNRGIIFELISNVDITRKRKFYKRDNEGYYYIPEVLKHYGK